MKINIETKEIFVGLRETFYTSEEYLIDEIHKENISFIGRRNTFLHLSIHVELVASDCWFNFIPKEVNLYSKKGYPTAEKFSKVCEFLKRLS